MKQDRPMMIRAAILALEASNQLAEGKITPEALKAHAMHLREQINVIKVSIDIAKMAGVPLHNSAPLLEVQ